MPGLLTDTLLVGRYRLGPLLGRGGMAEVYDGFDERLERPVAVKVLRPEVGARPEVRQRFEVEARCAARLTHPNVVSVYDSGDDGGVSYLVMERLGGETLADRVAAGPLEPAWVLRVAGDVLTALQAAHAAGLVHRDVKPANVLITAEGTAKVADFGIAKSLDVAATADLTDTNQVIGTPAYLAPERIAGLPATVRSDLYAVGVLLYEALAGAKPFSGANAMAVAYAVRHHVPEPLARRRPDLDRRVAAGVDRAMARDPDRRFATAAELASALGVSLGPTVTAAAASAPAATATAPVPAGAAAWVPAGAPDVEGADPTAALPPALAPAAGGADPTAATAAIPDPGGGGADPAAALPPARPPAPAPAGRRRALAAGLGLALVVVLGVLALGPGTGDSRPPDHLAELAGELRSAATGLAPADGQAWDEAEVGLEALAAVVESGAGGREATALLGQLARWRDAGELAAPAVERLRALVARVPGVDLSAFTPPTTAAVAPEEEEEEHKDDAEDDEDAGSGPGKGKGKGRKDD